MEKSILTASMEQKNTMAEEMVMLKTPSTIIWYNLNIIIITGMDNVRSSNIFVIGALSVSVVSFVCRSFSFTDVSVSPDELNDRS